MIKRATASMAAAAAVLIGVAGCAGPSYVHSVCESFADATNLRVDAEAKYLAFSAVYGEGADELGPVALDLQDLYRDEYDTADAARGLLAASDAETELVPLFRKVISYGRDLPARADYLGRDRAAQAAIAQCAAEGASVTYAPDED